MAGTVFEGYLNCARDFGYGGKGIVFVCAAVAALLCVCDPSFTFNLWLKV